MFFNIAYFDENNSPCEVQIICNKCEEKITVKDSNISVFSVIKSDYCILNNGKSIVCQCGNIHNNELLEYKKNIELKKINNFKPQNIPKCPKCGSTQITAVNRKWSLLTGFMTNKTDRFCLGCKYKW